MKVMVIPIVIDALGTITKIFVKELEDLEIRGQVVTIRTVALLRSVRKLRKFWLTLEGLLSLKLQYKIIS